MPTTPPTSPHTDSPDGSSPILTVSQLTAKIKALVEERFPFIWVQGEISNLRQPPSGHLYFTLKDEDAQISAVVFRGQRRHLKFEPQDGHAITGLGRISVYEPRGTYQIILEFIEPAGIGALQIAFERLKTRLAADGYFDDARKQSVPFLPAHISLITSPGGAVVHDMLKVIARRFPNLAVDVVAVSVQGAEAVSEIVAGLELVNRLARSDVAVLARGGGSLEDLQPFNSEAVAMAIADSSIPVVSAIGHETDYTISDFVADLRAPTPSAAIEMILPDKREVNQRLTMLTASLISNINNYYNKLLLYCQSLTKRIVHPQKRVQELWLRLDDDTSRLFRFIQQFHQFQAQHLTWWRQRLLANSPEFQIKNHKQKLDTYENNLLKSLKLNLLNHRKNIGLLSARLSALSPLAVLQRGYSITRTLPGRSVVIESKQVQVGQRVEVILAAGQLQCQVEGRSDHGQEDF